MKVTCLSVERSFSEPAVLQEPGEVSEARGTLFVPGLEELAEHPLSPGCEDLEELRAPDWHEHSIAPVPVQISHVPGVVAASLLPRQTARQAHEHHDPELPHVVRRLRPVT